MHYFGSNMQQYVVHVHTHWSRPWHQVWRGKSPGNPPRPIRGSPTEIIHAPQSVWPVVESCWVLVKEATIATPVTLA